MPHTSDRDCSVPCNTLCQRIPTDEDCITGIDVVYSPPKSAKRKRAEELLEQRYARQQKHFRIQSVDTKEATTVPASLYELSCSR